MVALGKLSRPTLDWSWAFCFVGKFDVNSKNSDEAHMLKREPNGKFVSREEDVFQDKKLLGVAYGKAPVGRIKYWKFQTDTLSTKGELDDEAYNNLLTQQQSIPVSVMRIHLRKSNGGCSEVSSTGLICTTLWMKYVL